MFDGIKLTSQGPGLLPEPRVGATGCGMRGMTEGAYRPSHKNASDTIDFPPPLVH